ncbi:hypothetical protein M0638_11730 [Roseomonas sp. NAR14]|uniref:Uncharacterized protein n=1 Tax=Roseomonas acroporae TaxID=2937791 RepID=A0A9X2BWK2_9PROT|nr:hypothetical protein [Roseomonas acroporae]MCK8785054.1 hypothetical protein [Roseomonas acroporae]
MPDEGIRPPQQPWLPGAAATGVPDDFSARSDTRRLPAVATALALACLVLAAGRSAEIVDAAYGLPNGPGSETAIALAEGWHAAMERIGVAALVGTVRALRGTEE